MIIDTHCHLPILIEEKGVSLDQIFSEIHEQKTNAILSIISSPEELLITEKYHYFSGYDCDLFFAAGIHPHEAEKYHPDLSWIQHIRDKICAIGECGLDYYYNFSSQTAQRMVLKKMITLAQELEKPLIIHGREGENEIINLLEAEGFKNRSVVFHCYTGSAETARRIIDNGWSLSFSGIITFPKSEELRQVLQITPLSQLMFETDSPFLAPVPFRGRINTPAKVSAIYRFAAQFLGIELQVLEKHIAQNFYRYFNLPME